MSVSLFMAVLRARWWFALLVALATVSAATLVILLVPRTWSSTASLLIDTSRPDPVTGLSNGGNPSPALLATQVGVIRSERVALDVVRRLDLGSDPLWRKDWTAATQGQGDMSRWLAQALQKTTEILPERDSNVVSITTTARSPEEAARVANAFAQAYLEVSSTMRAENARGVSTFFTQRADELRAGLEKARARLAEFQQKNGIVVSDVHLDSETSRLNELAARWASSDATAADAQAGQGTEALQVQASPLIVSLRSDLFRAEAHLQGLTARLDDNHPDVIQARAAVLSLRQRIDAESRRMGGAVDASRAARAHQAAELRAAVDAQRARVARLRAAQDDGQGLAREVDNLQRAYDAVQARLGQAKLESHAIQGNATLLAPAAVPYAPSSPRRLVQVALAALLAVLLGGAAVTVWEIVDPRLRVDEAVATQLDQPLLGVIPRPDGPGAYRPRKLPLVGSFEPPRLSQRHQEA